MLRRAVRWVLLLVLAASVAGTVLMAAKIAADPDAAPEVTATPAEIRLRVDAELATRATPQTVIARLTALSASHPRNWLAVLALLDFARAQGVALPQDLRDGLSAAKEDDFGLYAFPASCDDCAADPARCPFAQVVICQTPLGPAPAADAATLPTLASAAAAGDPGAQAVLALALLDIAADDLAPVINADAATLRQGAALARRAAQMQDLSPTLTTLASDAVIDGADWAALPQAATADAARAAVTLPAFVPLARLAAALGSWDTAIDPNTALSLLPLAEDAGDVQALGAAAAALGPKAILAAEILGKPALVQSTRHPAKTGWALVIGLAGSWLSLALLVGIAVKRRQRRRNRVWDDPDEDDDAA